MVCVVHVHLLNILSIPLVFIGTQESDEGQNTAIFRPLQRLEQNVFNIKQQPL